MPASKAQRALTAQRRADAIALKLAGADWAAIARQLGYSGAAAACKDVTRALEAATREQREQAEMLRQVELARLDRIQVGLWTAAAAGDPRAAEVVLKVIAQRIKLLGLDAVPPPRIEEAKSVVGALAASLRAAYDAMGHDDADDDGEPDA